MRASVASAQRAWKQKANIKQMFFKARPRGVQWAVCGRQKRNNELVGRLEVGNRACVLRMPTQQQPVALAVDVAVSTKQTMSRQLASRQQPVSVARVLCVAPSTSTLSHPSLSLPLPCSLSFSFYLLCTPHSSSSNPKIYDNAARS